MSGTQALTDSQQREWLAWLRTGECGYDAQLGFCDMKRRFQLPASDQRLLHRLRENGVINVNEQTGSVEVVT